MASFTDKASFEKYWTYFNRKAAVEYDGKTYKFSYTDYKSVNKGGNYWHSETDPSSWLVYAMVNLALRKWRKIGLPREKIVDLCAQALNVTPEKIESSLDWTAHYLAFKDGDDPANIHPFGQG